MESVTCSAFNFVYSNMMATDKSASNLSIDCSMADVDLSYLYPGDKNKQKKMISERSTAVGSEGS